MGRSLESVRMGVRDVSARWLKASRALKKEDQVYGQRLSGREAFYALDDPPNVTIFSALVEMLKETDKVDRKNGYNEIELTSPT